MCMKAYDLDIHLTQTIKGTGLDELLAKSHALIIAELPLIEELVAYKAFDNETKLDTQPWYDPIIYLFINIIDPPDMTCLSRKMSQVNFIGSPGKRFKLYIPPLKLENPQL